MDYSHALKKLVTCLVAIIASIDYTSQLRYGGVHAQGVIDIFAKVYLIMISDKSIIHNKLVTLKFCQRKVRATSFGYKIEEYDIYIYFFSRFLLNSYYHARCSFLVTVTADVPAK